MLTGLSAPDTVMTMTHDPNCLFCKIVQGQIPSKKVHEDEHIYAFHAILIRREVSALSAIPEPKVGRRYSICMCM